MALLDCMDAVAVHAAAAATAAVDSKFNDVAVGHPAAKGRMIRVFYGGERESVYFGPGSLNSEHMAEVIGVTAMWPTSDTGVNRQRVIEGAMAAFARSFRTRIDGDYTLGGQCTALKMQPAEAGYVVEASTKYAVLDWEIGIDLGDYTQSP